jgi:hypothetical protein
MAKEEIRDTLNSLFDRAIIALSYSAANRITIFISSRQDQEIKPVFVIFIISLTAALIVLNSKLLQVSGVQTSLSILISKLLISIFPLPEDQTGYILLPSIIFYLILCATLCSFINYSVKESKLSAALWNRVVPFIILFSSSIILQVLTRNSQMKPFYFIALCYIVFVQYYSFSSAVDHGGGGVPEYLFLFIDSVMCRALVLGIQDVVKSKIDNMDIAVIFFNTVLVILGYSIVSMNEEQTVSQIRYCLGVMVFTISQQLFTIIQKKFDNDIIHSFIITTSVITVLLYNHDKFTRPLYFLCINCLSLAWTLLIEVWISSFYSSFEPFIIYFIIFIIIQTFQDWAVHVFNFSKGIYHTHQGDLVASLYSYEAIVIAHEASSNVGLP